MNQREQKLIASIKKIEPKTPAELKRGGIRIRRYAFGCFRKVYKLIGFSLVIKFPLSDTHELRMTRSHARKEQRSFRRLQISLLRALVPEILYWNSRWGVTVVRFYKPSRGRYDKIAKRLQNFFRQPDIRDYMYKNFGYTRRGKIKILDLGLS